MILAEDALTFLDYVSRGGVVVILLVILYAGYKRWWVWGWQLIESEERCSVIAKDRDEWKTMALRGTTLAEKALTHAKE